MTASSRSVQARTMAANEECDVDDSQTVMVYSFRVPGYNLESRALAGYKATRDAIARIADGEILESTAEEVCTEELDALGCFRRIPTGWAHLG